MDTRIVPGEQSSDFAITKTRGQAVGIGRTQSQKEERSQNGSIHNTFLNCVTVVATTTTTNPTRGVSSLHWGTPHSQYTWVRQFRHERTNTNKLNRKVGHDNGRHDKIKQDSFRQARSSYDFCSRTRHDVIRSSHFRKWKWAVSTLHSLWKHHTIVPHRVPYQNCQQ